MIQNRFILRRVAGKNWLLDVGQPGFPYKQPLGINETGADICERLLQGMSDEEIIEDLAGEYEVDRSQIEADLRPFIRQLRDMVDEAP